MKTSQLLSIIVAFAVGAALVFGIGKLNQPDDSDTKQELAELRAELDRLKGKEDAGDRLSAAGSVELPDAGTTTTDVVQEKEEEPAEERENVDPAEAMEQIVNSKEARNFMKRMSAGFAQRGEQWIEQGIEQYRDKLNLTDTQVERLRSRMKENMDAQIADFQTKVDDENMSMTEIMQTQRENWEGQEDVMEEILREELNEDQFADFKREQLVERTERVQRDADRELSSLDRSLELSESQEDEVFGILVQKNSDYDESMAIEGAGSTASVDSEVSKEDAIRSVLDAEQTEKYNAQQERRNRWRGGFGRGR